MTIPRSDGNPCNLTLQGVPPTKVVLDSVMRSVLLGTMEGSTMMCSLEPAGAGSTGQIDDGESPQR